MPLTIEGYLQQPYLETPYLCSTAQQGIGAQVNRALRPYTGNTQVNRAISTTQHYHMSVGRSSFLQEVCGEYLIKPYLATPYLPNDICAMGPMQVNRHDGGFGHTKLQVLRGITRSTPFNSQVQRVVTVSQAFHMQVRAVHIFQLMLQATKVLYNTTNLRVLLKFPSRGNTGINWTASSSAPGDYGVNNLNNDIVEFAWRSNTGDISAAYIQSDTQIPQGVFVDTVALLGHNLTVNATVIMQGSMDPTFTTVGFETTLAVTLLNMYYIAPTLPSAGYRYWRFLLQDSTNPSPYLQVGTVVFGAAIIFIGDDVVDSIRFSRKHFKDVITTEGFTNITNDRALKRMLGLQFRALDFQKGNYLALSNLFNVARTSLKCLWIPTPQYPDRFALFAKLVQLPEETHNDKGVSMDYIDLNVDLDESL